MNKQIGKTAKIGFEVGVRKICNISCDDAWELIVSKKGLSQWLGELDDYTFTKDTIFKTKDGIEGKVTTFNPKVNIRMNWKMKDWQEPSILQIRTIDSGGKTTISFHQEKLKNSRIRNEMKEYWTEALIRLELCM